MYISPLKTIIVEGLRKTFDDIYPNEYFRNVNIALDYPVADQEYPAIFVAYDDSDALRRAGISMVEYFSDADARNKVNPFARWRFHGNISLTVVSIASALERDELYDEMVGVIAFGREDPDLIGRFHTYIDSNDLIACTLQTDILQPRGSSAAKGTPWGTEEVMFERTLDLEIIGEFIPNPKTYTLVDLSKIVVHPHASVDGGTDDLWDDDVINIPKYGI